MTIMHIVTLTTDVIRNTIEEEKKNIYILKR
jgi:hypothetical protein